MIHDNCGPLSSGASTSNYGVLRSSNSTSSGSGSSSSNPNSSNSPGTTSHPAVHQLSRNIYTSNHDEQKPKQQPTLADTVQLQHHQFLLHNQTFPFQSHAQSFHSSPSSSPSSQTMQPQSALPLHFHLANQEPVTPYFAPLLSAPSSAAQTHLDHHRFYHPYHHQLQPQASTIQFVPDMNPALRAVGGILPTSVVDASGNFLLAAGGQSIDLFMTSSAPGIIGMGYSGGVGEGLMVPSPDRVYSNSSNGGSNMNALGIDAMHGAPFPTSSLSGMEMVSHLQNLHGGAGLGRAIDVVRPPSGSSVGPVSSGPFAELGSPRSMSSASSGDDGALPTSAVLSDHHGRSDSGAWVFETKSAGAQVSSIGGSSQFEAEPRLPLGSASIRDAPSRPSPLVIPRLDSAGSAVPAAVDGPATALSFNTASPLTGTSSFSSSSSIVSTLSSATPSTPTSAAAHLSLANPLLQTLQRTGGAGRRRSQSNLGAGAKYPFKRTTSAETDAHPQPPIPESLDAKSSPSSWAASSMGAVAPKRTPSPRQTARQPSLPVGKVAIPMVHTAKPVEQVILPEVRNRILDEELLKLDLSDVTVTHLKDLLRNRGLSTVGRKAALVDRIKEQIQLIKLRAEGKLAPEDDPRSPLYAQQQQQQPRVGASCSSVSPTPSATTLSTVSTIGDAPTSSTSPQMNQNPTATESNGASALPGRPRVTTPNSPESPSSVTAKLALQTGLSAHLKRGGGASPIVPAPRSRPRSASDVRVSQFHPMYTKSSDLPAPIVVTSHLNMMPMPISTTSLSASSPYSSSVSPPTGHSSGASTPLFPNFFSPANPGGPSPPAMAATTGTSAPFTVPGQFFLPSPLQSEESLAADFPPMNLQDGIAHYNFGGDLGNVAVGGAIFGRANAVGTDTTMQDAGVPPLSASVRDLTLGFGDLELPTDHPFSVLNF
ncbi:hypothetical protein DFJ73DRAFT_777693 [Zopfochytrium polystomum]|nr:hypothetical protein DFJ73DRAFT_777693 [Zopfochytrium polystomum]